MARSSVPTRRSRSARCLGTSALYARPVQVHDPPFPDYQEQSDFRACRDYRVVFWEQQLPASDTPPSPGEIGWGAHPTAPMGWEERTVDLIDVEDVQEAIEWAEANVDAALDRGRSAAEPHGRRLYVLYVKVPEEDRYLHISGWVPVRDPGAGRDYNLARPRP